MFAVKRSMSSQINHEYSNIQKQWIESIFTQSSTENQSNSFQMRAENIFVVIFAFLLSSTSSENFNLHEGNGAAEALDHP
jgi:hypothetical protein